MNKKIQELARQAGLQPYSDAQQRHIDKFAELIVHECALIAADADSDYYDIMLNTFGIQPDSVSEDIEDPIAKVDRLFRGQ